MVRPAGQPEVCSVGLHDHGFLTQLPTQLACSAGMLFDGDDTGTGGQQRNS